jgi:hypothetical protein
MHGLVRRCGRLLLLLVSAALNRRRPHTIACWRASQHLRRCTSLLRRNRSPPRLAPPAGTLAAVPVSPAPPRSCAWRAATTTAA